MKISKIYILLFIIGILINIDLVSMKPAGGSRRYREFIEEISKAKPNSSTLSDWYYEIEDSNEQQAALKSATEKGVNISGQEDEQKKIKAQILKDIKASQEKRSPKEERKSGKEEENMSLDMFERLLRIGATQTKLESAFNQLDANSKDKALERSAYYGVTIPGYKNKQRSYTLTQVSEVQDKILQKSAELDSLIGKNKDSKNVLDDRLTLAEQVQTIKEDVQKTQKQININDTEVKKLQATSEVKESNISGLVKSQNTQLKNQNADLKEQIDKLEKQLASLKTEKK